MHVHEENESVRLLVFTNHVGFLEGHHFVETVFNNVSVVETRVTLITKFNVFVHFVDEKFIPSVIVISVMVVKIELLFSSDFEDLINISFHPSFEDAKLKNSLVSSLSFEVSIIKTITSISQGNSHGIDSVSVHDFTESLEVTCRFRHLLSVEE